MTNKAIEDYRYICEQFSSSVSLPENYDKDDILEAQVYELLTQVVRVPLYAEPLQAESLWQVFFEHKVMDNFLNCLQNYSSRNIQTRVLSSLSLLVQNAREEFVLYFILSSPVFNQVLSFPFDRTSEDVVSHLVELLKVTTWVLNNQNLDCLFDRASFSFPLYETAVELVDYPERMISTVVKYIILQIFQLQDEALQQFLLNDVEGNAHHFLQQRYHRIQTFSRNVMEFWKVEREVASPLQLRNAWNNFLDTVEYFGDILTTLKFSTQQFLLQRLEKEFMEPFLDCMMGVQKIISSLETNTDPIFPIFLEFGCLLNILTEKTTTNEGIFQYLHVDCSFSHRFNSIVECLIGFMNKSADEMILYACSMLLEICVTWLVQHASWKGQSKNRQTINTIPIEAKQSLSPLQEQHEHSEEHLKRQREECIDNTDLAILLWNNCLKRLLRQDSQIFLSSSWRCICSFGRLTMISTSMTNNSSFKRNVAKELMLQLKSEFVARSSNRLFHPLSPYLSDMLQPFAGSFSLKDLLIDRELFQKNLLGTVSTNLNDPQCLLAWDPTQDELAQYEFLYNSLRILICIRTIDECSPRQWIKDLTRALDESSSSQLKLTLEDVLRKSGILQEILEEENSRSKSSPKRRII
eukprot:jgi/Galph1/4429/GphlegSOOS_G3032.1